VWEARKDHHSSQLIGTHSPGYTGAAGYRTNPVMNLFRAAARALILLLVASVGRAWAASGEAPAYVPSAAERIFASAPQRLLQVRTLVVGSDRQSSTGSGFLVSADGLAVTN
jgi:hypothetical protein